MTTLTRKDQVMEVLRAGGTLCRPHHARALLQLRDAAGNEVDAWQQAMTAAGRQYPSAFRSGAKRCA